MKEKTKQASGLGKHFGQTAQFFKMYTGLLIGMVAMCLVFGLGSEYFFTLDNLITVLRQVSANALIAAALTMVFITGGIDLSTGNILAMAGVFAAGFISNQGMPVWLGVTLALLSGLVIGLLNGVFAAFTKMPPFIITYSVGNICKGITYLYSNAQNIRITDKAFTWLGAGFIGPIPVPIIIAALVFIVVGLILGKTKLGRHMYAVGGNETAARYAGINIAFVRLFMYAFTGLMSALAGIVIAARVYSGQPTAGADTSMSAIASVVLGGVSMGGGRGGVGGVIFGCIILGAMSNGLNLIGVDSYWQYIVRGIIIIAAVFVDYMRESGKGRKKKAAK